MMGGERGGARMGPPRDRDYDSDHDDPNEHRPLRGNRGRGRGGDRGYRGGRGRGGDFFPDNRPAEYEHQRDQH